jgi:hypothetical protein
VKEMELPETCRASVKINKFKKCCIILAVICNYIAMHRHINIKGSVELARKVNGFRSQVQRN